MYMKTSKMVSNEQFFKIIIIKFMQFQSKKIYVCALFYLDMYPSLLAVIFTILDESGLGMSELLETGLPTLVFIKETVLWPVVEATGVITNLAGGVLGLGGRSETFTSMGAMREPSNGLWSWTMKPARARTQSGSLQDLSQTASR